MYDCFCTNTYSKCTNNPRANLIKHSYIFVRQYHCMIIVLKSFPHTLYVYGPFAIDSKSNTIDPFHFKATQHFLSTLAPLWHASFEALKTISKYKNILPLFAGASVFLTQCQKLA